MLNVMNKPIRTLLIILCAAPLLVAPLPAATQEQAAAALPPEAQQAFDRGLKAVQQQEWGLATRYFSDAQKTSPYAPTVLFNLGLAHARAGHELPAIAWLEAYLTVTPQAPNAEAVRAEIERLKTVTRGKMNTIFQTSIAGAQQLDPSDQWSAFYGISLRQAYAGDIDGAIATYKLTSNPEEIPKYSSKYWSAFPQQLIRDGDLEGAQEALKKVTEAKDQDEVWECIIDKILGSSSFLFNLGHIGSGDLETARNAAKKIHDADKRGKLLRQVRIAVLTEIVNENARKGDFDFVPVEELFSLLEYDSWRISQLLSIAEQQKKFKDAEGKSQTINRALNLARQAQKPSERAGLLVGIAWSLFEQGEIPSAKAIAKETLACGTPAAGWDDFCDKEKANIKVIDGDDAVKAYAILGNVSEALALIRRTKSDGVYLFYKNHALGSLVYIQVMSGDIKGARQTEAIAAGIFDNREKDDWETETGWVQMMLADAQLKKGDYAGALETLKRSRMAHDNFAKTCGEIFDHLMTAGQVSKAMEVAKLIGEVSHRKENIWNREGAAKEYVREMGLIQMQAAGDKAGKPEAAQVTTNFVQAGNWIALAIEVSTDERTGNLEKALKDAAEAKGRFDYDYAKTAKGRIDNLADVARNQGITLNKISALERKSGQ